MPSPFLPLGPTSAPAGRGGGGSDGGMLFLPSRVPIALVGRLARAVGRRWRTASGFGPVAAAGRGGEQDHYAVLGLARSASATDIKRAFRLLARKYHPDVCNDLQAGEKFKSIRFAYEVLSDEVSRAQYDMRLEYPGITEGTSRNFRNQYPESDEEQRIYRWMELRQRMRYSKQRKKYSYSWYGKRVTYQESARYERGPFTDVLRFAFFTVFFMQTIGYRASLTFCSIMALLDKQLDVGYKMGFVIALLLGGRGGILLSLFIYFASWLCGKSNSSLVVVVVLAMWLAANLARFTPLPQGAVLTLLYMSIKLQVDSK